MIKKKFEKSIELFEKILEKEPNNSEIITNKATCLVELGRYEESVEQLERKNENSDHEHDHIHEHGDDRHEHFLNKIKKDPDFIGLQNSITFKKLIR